MQVMFAVFCAKQVLHLISNKERDVCLNAIAFAEGFIEGKTVEYVNVYAAGHTMNPFMASYLVRVVNNVAFSSYFTESVADTVFNTQNANKKTIEQEQIRYYNELLNFDKIVEDLMGISL